MKRNQVLNHWRICWYQLVDGVRRLRWHTGPRDECEILRQACVAAHEQHWLREPGTFI